jgi:glycosyltransferase involved in cell wall biosynthesis
MTPNPALPMLTIAIPTFNRRASVLALAHEIGAVLRADQVEAVIVDDGSEDGTYEALFPLQKLYPGLRVLRNNSNLGYPHTFIRCLRESRAEWILISADDDRIDFAALERAQRELDVSSADLYSTLCYDMNGHCYRGLREKRNVRPDELYKAFSHAPGLIYRRQAVVKILSVLTRALAEGSEAALLYPQVVLAAEFVVRNAASWLPAALVYVDQDMPSNIVDSRGLDYWDPLSRLHQFLAFDRLFRRMLSACESGGSAKQQSRCLQLLRANELELGFAFEALLLAGCRNSSRRLHIISLRMAFQRLRSRIPPWPSRSRH